MFYMTCSVFNEENSDQVAKFLALKKSEFDLTYSETIWPEVMRNDGFYLAILEKK